MSGLVYLQIVYFNKHKQCAKSEGAKKSMFS